MSDTAPAGTPPAGTPPAPTTWYNDFQDVGVKDWLKSYGEAYPNAEAVALKAQNLEKFLGAEKSGRGIVAPKPDAPPEEWQAFYKKVGGVPEKADGYKIPQELSADPMIGGFRDAMHKAGMPPMFFEAAMNWYSGAMKGQQDASVVEFERKAEAEMQELQREWSGKDERGVPIYDKNVELGRRAAKQFVPHDNPQQLEEILTSMEGALGAKTMLKLWASIGGSVGEHSFHQGGGDGGHGGAMSAEAARMRIAERKRDTSFAAKLVSRDAETVAEWDRLHKIAYSSQ